MTIRRARVVPGYPKVSVVIPCYQYGHFLSEAVRSALDQPRVDVEVIVVDDASPDDTFDIATQLAARDNRVTVIRHQTNKGHIATYNDGLEAATGDFVTLVSADDLIAPGALARATDLMRLHESVGLVYGRPSPFSDAIPEQNRLPTWWIVHKGHQFIQLACRHGRNYILSPEVVMRTSALREVGPYRTDFPHSGDLELWLRTAARWDVGRVNGPYQAFYRVHGSNMHLTEFSTMPFDLRARAVTFDTLNEHTIADFFPDAQHWNNQARRALAREALILARRELDHGHSQESIREFVDVARETYAPIASSYHMRRVENHPGTRRPASIACTRIYESIRWRTWHQIGIAI